MGAELQAEPLYAYTLAITRIVDYGVPAQVVFAGEAPPPPEGVRLDVYFEGRVGGRLNGTARGVDYVHVRADGRVQLDIHAELTTDDGKRIAFAADGVALPEKGSPVLRLRENVTLTTSHPEYTWVNPLQIWASGTVDVASGEIRVTGFVERGDAVSV